MTWRDVEDLLEYWKDYPPLHQIVARIVGINPAEQVEEGALNPAEMMARYQATNGKAVG